MSGEKIGLLGQNGPNGFYAGDERSADEAGTSGISRRMLHGLTIIAVLIAFGCSIYGTVLAESPVIVLPFVTVIMWIVIHCFLIVFARKAHHEFNPPGWFIFVSSGNIVIQSLVVIILTLFKK